MGYPVVSFYLLNKFMQSLSTHLSNLQKLMGNGVSCSLFLLIERIYAVSFSDGGSVARSALTHRLPSSTSVTVFSDLEC